MVGQAKEIIVEGWQAMADSRIGAKSMAEAMQAHDVIKAAMNERLVALLGQDAFEQLEASKQTGALDWAVGTDLWDGGAPLSTTQLHALALAQVRLGYEPTNTVMTPKPDQAPDPSTGLSAQDERLLEASRGFLLPAQLHLLRQSCIDENRYNAAMRSFAAKQRQLWEQAARKE